MEQTGNETQNKVTDALQNQMDLDTEVVMDIIDDMLTILREGKNYLYVDVTACFGLLETVTKRAITTMATRPPVERLQLAAYLNEAMEALHNSVETEMQKLDIPPVAVEGVLEDANERSNDIGSQES
jgi:hypothetical protein